MKIGTLARGLCVLVTYCCLTAHLHGAIIIHVDMDADTVGIQSTRIASPGDSLKVAIVAEIDASGLSSYGFSVVYDSLEVSLDTADDTPPAGLTNLVAGAVDIDLGGGARQVASFDAFTFAAGPASTSEVLGTIEFTVVTPVDDGSFDITPGYFDVSDGAFDNTLPLGADLAPSTVFNAGTVVPIPEPNGVHLALLASVILIARRRRKP